jgi:hypothetical protein
MHGKNVSNAFGIFRKDQIFVSTLDMMRADPASVYRSILRHIGVPDDGRVEFPVENERLSHGRFKTLARALTASPPPWLRKTAAVLRLRGTGIRQGVATKLATPAEKLELAAEFKAMLREHFREDVRTLSALTGLDTSDWLRGD